MVQLFWAGLVAARRALDVTTTLIEITRDRSRFPCFSGARYGGGAGLRAFRARHFPELSDDELRPVARRLVDRACNHYGTRLYDRFQLLTNGIAE